MNQTPNDNSIDETKAEQNSEAIVAVNSENGQDTVLKLDDGLSCPIRTSVTFKKAIFGGLDPDEVYAYIDDQFENYNKTCQMYADRLEELKNNITLIARERDWLKVQNQDAVKRAEDAEERLIVSRKTFEEELSQALDAQEQARKEAEEASKDAAKSRAIAAEAEKASKTMSEQLSKAKDAQRIAEEELNKAKTKLRLAEERAVLAEDKMNEALNKLSSKKDNNELQVKFNDLSNKFNLLLQEAQRLKEFEVGLAKTAIEKENLEKKIESLNASIEKLKEENKKLANIISENNIQLEAYGKLKVDYSAAAAKLSAVEAELNSISIELNKKTDENEKQQATIADLRIRLASLEQQNEHLEKEISELRESLRAQMYEFAQKKNEYETAAANERLKLVKLIQVHSYHLKQSDSLLTELKKQFSHALETFDAIEKEDSEEE